MAKHPITSLREFMNLTKALADEKRVRALLGLRDGELCVCQITELFRLAPSTISKHLSILHQAGLIESRKTERWVYYRLPGKEAPVVVRAAIDWLQRCLVGTPQAGEDRRRLAQILKVKPATLCHRQARR
ncbi:MAG: ArsR/SmtB family transcription factor [Limisphaerales bacterium]